MKTGVGDGMFACLDIEEEIKQLTRARQVAKSVGSLNAFHHEANLAIRLAEKTLRLPVA